MSFAVLIVVFGESFLNFAKKNNEEALRDLDQANQYVLH